ncbi:hypothetical protein BDZ89DRAFT_1151263 [Hymenopellis radicata]|nr:hypothetical protein BDZ89DRAFT_1151759 [Hymenopellis radicata]KAF8992067.1 hypothetical protein BDZ89DRAFT_1151263 [Hymenopellis radicata]
MSSLASINEADSSHAREDSSPLSDSDPPHPSSSNTPSLIGRQYGSLTVLPIPRVDSLESQPPTADANMNDDRTSSPDSDDIREEAPADEVEIRMLEAHAEQVRRGQATPDRRDEDSFSESLGLTDFERFLSDLEEIIASPPDADLVYQKVKKDIFHTFDMIPTSVHHGL